MRLRRFLPEVLEVDADRALAGFYEQCVSQCVAWFGTPPDADWPTTFCLHSARQFARVASARVYIVSIKDVGERGFSVAFSLASAAFHRTCDTRLGQMNLPWASQALECRSTIHLLSDPVASCVLDPAGYEIATYVDEQNRWLAHFDDNRELSRALDWGKLRGRRLVKPRMADGAAWVIGVLLEDKIGWDKFCGMVDFPSYAAWLQSLSTEQSTWLTSITDGSGRSF